MRACGLAAFGLDWSPALLARALAAEEPSAPSRGARALPSEGPGAPSRGASEERPLVGRVVRADMRALPFALASFDAVACLFNSFGYFDDRENARVLDEARGVLRSDARLFLDLMNAGRTRATLVPASERALGATRIVERRRLGADDTRVEKEVVLIDGERVRDRWIESVRLYEPAELERELARAGFVVERMCGDWDGRTFGADAPRMLVVARART
jgi:SAM-dependent methyltransferase